MLQLGENSVKSIVGVRACSDGVSPKRKMNREGELPVKRKRRYSLRPQLNQQLLTNLWKSSIKNVDEDEKEQA